MYNAFKAIKRVQKHRILYLVGTRERVNYDVRIYVAKIVLLDLAMAMYRGTLCGLILLLGCPPAAESSVVYLFRHCIRSCDTSGLQAYASQPWAYVKKYLRCLKQPQE